MTVKEAAERFREKYNAPAIVVVGKLYSVGQYCEAYEDYLDREVRQIILRDLAIPDTSISLLEFHIKATKEERKNYKRKRKENIISVLTQL